MVDDRVPELTREDRRRLRKETAHAVRLLAQSLEQEDDAPDSVAEGQALVARLQAAIEPLRATAAALSGVNQDVHVQDRVAVLDTATITLTPHDATHAHTAGNPEVRSGGSGATVRITASGAGSGTWGWRGTAEGSTSEPFQVTADDTPWILWQILLRLDDLANPGKPPITVGQVYDRLMPLLSILLTLLLS